MEEQNELKEFEVIITETMKMRVFIEAQSKSEAEEIVTVNWQEGEYLIDDEYFYISGEFEVFSDDLRKEPKNGKKIEIIKSS